MTPKKLLPLNQQKKRRKFGEKYPSWFLQEKHWELGDFVSCTGMLRALSEAWGEKVPVFFDTPYVAELYGNNQYIEVLAERPPTFPFGDSKSPRNIFRQLRDSNYDAQHKAVFGHYSLPRAPFVEDCRTPPLLESLDLPKDVSDSSLFAFIHGCYSEHLREAKTIPPKIMVRAVLFALDSGFVPTILGSKADIPYWDQVMKGLLHIEAESCRFLVGELSIRESVGVLQSCRYFTANDTGMYHVAAASGISGTVWWKDSPLNVAPSQKVKLIKRDYYEAFKNWFFQAVKE